MDLVVKHPKLLATAAVAAGSLAALRFLHNAGVPKDGAEWRAELAKEWWVKYLKATPHFDQFLRDLEIKRMAPDGKTSGSLVVTGALLSADGVLHEAGLIDLVDTFGSLAVMAAAYPPGVSVEIGASILSQVWEGEELNVTSEIMRIGSTLAFTSVEVRGADGRLVASGTHTKHIADGTWSRIRRNLANRCPPLARWLQKAGWKKLEDTVKGLPKAEAKNMEEALGLQLLPPESGAHSWAMESLHLLNGYWAGHGASSAGLLAAAAREHMKQSGIPKVTFQDMSVLYMNPVPRFKPVGCVVSPLCDPDDRGRRQYVVSLANESKVFVRGRLTAVAC